MMLTVYSVLMCFHHMCSLPKSVSAKLLGVSDRQFIIAINLNKLLFTKEFFFFFYYKRKYCKCWLNISMWSLTGRNEHQQTMKHTAHLQQSSVHLAQAGLCFLHVLVIVKHNNGFYKSQFTSLVMWIIQPEWQREGESAAPLRWVLHLRWEVTEDGILSELFICFPSTFSHPYLYSFSLSTVPPSHTGAHTHTANSHFYFMQR